MAAGSGQLACRFPSTHRTHSAREANRPVVERMSRIGSRIALPASEIPVCCHMEGVEKFVGATKRLIGER